MRGDRMGYKRKPLSIEKIMAKPFVRYDEGAERYSMGVTKFMELADEAGAVARVSDRRSLVDCEKFEAFLRSYE